MIYCKRNFFLLKSTQGFTSKKPWKITSKKSHKLPWTTIIIILDNFRKIL